MKISQFIYSKETGWQPHNEGDAVTTPDVILVFGNRQLLQKAELCGWLNEQFADAPIIGCSTAGEILDTEVHENTVSATAIQFEKAQTQRHFVDFSVQEDSYEVGKKLASKFNPEGLRWVFILSDGLNINGTQLVSGITECLPDDVIITGGLAGDGGDFTQTQVCFEKQLSDHRVVALGLYGEDLEVGYGSLGGWDPFGPDRKVTKADANVLYELDGQSALELYKNYLGDYAKDLPASGLLFPLTLTDSNGQSVVRTLLSINEEDQSMTFAGDIPEGQYARLMKANFDRLVDGAYGAAEQTQKTNSMKEAELAILISCVGRKMVLEQRVEEEVEAVREVLGEKPKLTGFYSYGEICPILDRVGCTLHNQTMTITTLSEKRGDAS